MLPKNRLRFACALGLLTLCFTASSRTEAQTNKPGESAKGDNEQTLQQLLREVRELRLTVQKATVSNTRFQMLIERLRVQQAHVDGLSRQLENLHSQIADMKAAKPQMEQQIRTPRTCWIERLI